MELITMLCGKVRSIFQVDKHRLAIFVTRIQALKGKSGSIFRRLVLGIFFSLTATAFAQNKISTEDYIKTYQDIAIEKMREYKIPASITLAQGILESGSGNSSLAQKANNHFGIKCHKGWKGRTFIMDDDEKNECFRSYKKAEESYHDHSIFLTSRDRYADLFKLKITDYKGWAKGLSKAGYATNPRYPELLIRIIERYNLTQYDEEALKKTHRRKREDEKVDRKEYLAIDPSAFEVVDQSESGRFVHENNGVKLVFAREGDHIAALAVEFHIYSWQIIKYNDFEKDQQLSAGQIVYLQKKKRKSHDFDFHTIRSGETLRIISQLYGVRLSRLYKLNHLKEGDIIYAGENLKLR